MNHAVDTPVRRTCWTALALCAALVVGGCSGSSDGPVATASASSAAPVTGPLKVLLVDDDGWDAPGITALYDELVAAGDRVTLVAPLVNQSGRSMATSNGPLTVTRPAPGERKWAVDGTPVDSLTIGLHGILRDDRPDVVVSGINVGANVATNTNYSGTVGAAAAAAELGVPALAVSADVGGPKGEGDYADAARIVRELLVSLARTGFAGLGTDGFVNVNVPHETATRTSPRGFRVTPLAQAAPRTVTYDETTPGTWTPTFSYDARVGGRRSDAQSLADGWTTLTFLPVERTADPAGQRRLRALADDLG